MNQYNNNNIFAKILRKELPCISIYEDDDNLAFMDIMPQAPGHVLVIPKEPAVTLLDLSESSASTLINATQKVAKAVKTALNAEGISLFQLNGSAAGQTVPHIHFHVLPGCVLHLKQHANQPAEQEQLEEIAEKIRAAIN